MKTPEEQKAEKIEAVKKIYEQQAVLIKKMCDTILLGLPSRTRKATFRKRDRNPKINSLMDELFKFAFRIRMLEIQKHIIASQPIMKKEYPSEGCITVGERGAELIITKDGLIKTTPA